MDFVFFIYLFSGIIKSILSFYGIELPVDLTAITGALVLLGVIWRVSRNIERNFLSIRGLVSVSVLLLLFLWMMVTLMYTASETYSKLKVFFFATNIIAFIYPLVNHNLNIRKFLQGFILFVFVLMLWYIPHLMLYISKPFLHSIERYSEMSGQYLVLGFMSGFSVLLLLHRKDLFKPTIRIFLILFFIPAMFLIGSRGALLFTIIVWFVMVLRRLVITVARNIGIKRQGLIRSGIISVVFVLLVSVVSIGFSNKMDFLINRSLVRFKLLVNPDSHGESVDVRVDQIRFSLDKINKSATTVFLGYGIGSYGILESGEDGRAYPHNFILELQFETGLIGLVLFLIFLLTLFVGKRGSPDFKYLPAFLFLYFFLNYMKSWSIVDMRICFGLLGLYFLETWILEQQIETKKNDANGC
ncbi:MAG: O-antigen ligase family protein [Bacteroidota bacterium]|nr:O-antigen ligase family protein [Bacteroidota bacterium]